ncbi:hypothetical protein LOK49_LG06G01408 [Camellia lanceoleosa]|uniref:Uncharacterized protein n=1 Tax=Camellia lanceoleosa TaxID=1840588 RepID=A0ACC0HKI3_9ERIC|nr:hypothetical protein LOK49_LG06G01408 [Camellia lanceoleosa]
MGNLLVLQALITGSSVSEMEFSHCPFWVQVHGLPLDRMTRRNGQIIMSSIGSLIGVEGPHDDLLLYRSFLRIRVDIDVTKPHPIGRHSGYGPNLRTGVASTPRLPPEYYHRLTDEMEANLRPLLRWTPASVTVAENPTPVGVEGTSGSQSNYQNSTRTDEVPRHPPLSSTIGARADRCVSPWAPEDVHQAQFPSKLLKLTSETPVDFFHSVANQKTLAIHPHKARVRRAPNKKMNSKSTSNPDLLDVAIHNEMTLSSFLNTSQIVVYPASLELHGEDFCS